MPTKAAKIRGGAALPVAMMRRHGKLTNSASIGRPNSKADAFQIDGSGMS